MISAEPRDISVIQHTNLSRKDQQIKDRLFNRQPKPPVKPVQLPPENPSEKAFKSLYQAPSNTQIDDFLKNMEGEFKKTNESSFFIVFFKYFMNIYLKRTDFHWDFKPTDQFIKATEWNYQ